MSKDWSEVAFIEYWDEVERLIGEKTLITASDCTDPDSMANSQEAGWTPEEHVNWIIEKYGLESE